MRRSRALGMRLLGVATLSFVTLLALGGVASAGIPPEDLQIGDLDVSDFDVPPDFGTAPEANPSESTGPALDPGGQCNGLGILSSDGMLYDANKVNYVEIEASDGVVWQGWLDGHFPGEEGPEVRPYGGKVFVNIAGVDIEVGSWGPEGRKFGDSGVETWDFPLDIVKGIEIPLSGYHNEAGVRVCSGDGTLVIKGTSPLAYVAGGLALFSLLGIGISIAPRGS